MVLCDYLWLNNIDFLADEVLSFIAEHSEYFIINVHDVADLLRVKGGNHNSRGRVFSENILLIAFTLIAA